MPTIRSATHADVGPLADLLGELFAQEQEFAPDRTQQSRGLTLLLDRGDTVRIILAEDNGLPIAMGVLHYSISTYLGSPVAMLEDVIVTSAHRGRGVGQRLMAAIIEQARADNIARITLLTDHDNTAAQDFYAGFGFTRSTMAPFRLMLTQSLTA